MTTIRNSYLAPFAWVSVLIFLGGCSDLRGDRIDPPLASWAYEPELRIGAVDDPDFAFTRVAALLVGSDGTIYSLHPEESMVRRWTVDGRPAGSVGRRGEGPGEFSRPYGMGWQGDSLWVMDLGNYRFSFFAPEGTFLTTLSARFDPGSRTSQEAGDYPPRPAALLSDGMVLGITPAFSQAIAEGRLTRVARVRMNADGGVVDTIAVLPVGKSSVLTVLRDGGGTSTAQPFGDDHAATLTHDGSGLLVLDRVAAETATSAEFRVSRFDLGGDTVFSRGYAYEPVALPRTVVDSAAEATAESLHSWLGERTGTSLSQWRGWVRDAIYAPAYYTPVRAILAGRDGTIWLSLNDPEAEAQEWLVLAEDGEPLAKVRLPSELRVILADGAAVWGVETDDLGVEYIVRYRLSAG